MPKCVRLHITYMDNAISISIIIPNRDGAATLPPCLEAACAQDYPDFEVIVVDDNSSDSSVGIVREYNVTLIELKEHGGASAARNAGASAARGELLFFTDADCVIEPGTLKKAAEAHMETPDAVVGGTYTPLAYDTGFFSTFQSIFIHHNETKAINNPDYIATHAMIIGRETFERSGGFSEDFMPILEDVELSHRLREGGMKLRMDPDIMVGHIFNLNFLKSLQNAFKKSFYWARYSLRHGDLMADSGTASLGLKAMAACTTLAIGLFIAGLVSESILLLLLPPLPLILGLVLNAGIIEAFFRHGGPAFGLMAVPYYALPYSMAALMGGVSGMLGLGGRR